MQRCCNDNDTLVHLDELLTKSDGVANVILVILSCLKTRLRPSTIFETSLRTSCRVAVFQILGPFFDK